MDKHKTQWEPELEWFGDAEVELIDPEWDEEDMAEFWEEYNSYEISINRDENYG